MSAGFGQSLSQNWPWRLAGTLLLSLPATGFTFCIEAASDDEPGNGLGWLSVMRDSHGNTVSGPIDQAVPQHWQREKGIVISPDESVDVYFDAWERQRNTAYARWMFTTEKARTKLCRASPQPEAISERPVKES